MRFTKKFSSHTQYLFAIIKPILQNPGERYMTITRQTVERVGIIVIMVIFLAGSLGLYLYVVFQNNNTTTTNDSATTTPSASAEPVNKSYIVSGPINSLQTTDITPGTGATVQKGATIMTTYVGALASTGQIFDQSQTPVQFSLNSVIQGWAQGIPGMKVGGTRKLVIPASLGYGSTGTSDGSIPPNANLVFTVTVTSVVSQ